MFKYSVISVLSTNLLELHNEVKYTTSAEHSAGDTVQR